MALEIRWSGMDWIDLAQDREHWRAVVNTIINLRVSKNIDEFLSNCREGQLIG
jgi:hypothetical protein